MRRVIEELNPGRRFEHRLMDYNNLPTTSFADIKRVLQLGKLEGRPVRGNAEFTRTPLTVTTFCASAVSAQVALNALAMNTTAICLTVTSTSQSEP